MRSCWLLALGFSALICINFADLSVCAQTPTGHSELSVRVEDPEPYWQAWLSGHDVSHHEVFGIQIYILGRIGRFLLFIAGLSIVLDILGETGLQQMGQSIGTNSLYQRTVTSIKDAWQYLVDINRATYGKLSDREVNALSAGAFRYLRRPSTLIVEILLFTAFFWIRDWIVLSWWTLLGLFLSVALAPLFILIVSLVVSVPGVLLDVVFIRPLSAFLKRTHAGRQLRIVMLSSLIVGFLLDIFSGVPS
jgi:hypothetical protein